MTDKERRLQQQNIAWQNKLKKVSPIQFTANRFGPLMFAMTFGVIGMYLAVMTFASPAGGGLRAASLTIEPSSRQVAAGQTLTVRIWADSLDQPVNAVEAHLAYPHETFEFVSMDSSASSFSVDRASRPDAGRIVISRAATDPQGLIGRQLVAKVVFRAKGDAATASMSFAEGSKLLRAYDQTDILERTDGGYYRISSAK